MKYLNKISAIIFIIIIQGCITMLWEKPDRTSDLWETESMLRNANDYNDAIDYKEILNKLENIYLDNKGIYRRIYIKPYVLYLIGCVNVVLAEKKNDKSYYNKAIEKFNLSNDYVKMKIYENRGTDNPPYFSWTEQDSINLEYSKRWLTAMNYGQRAFVEMKMQNNNKAISDLKYFLNNVPKDDNGYYPYLQYYNLYEYASEYEHRYIWKEASELLFDRCPYYYLALMQYQENDYYNSSKSIDEVLTIYKYEENEEKYLKDHDAKEFFGEVFLLKGKIQIQTKEKNQACKSFEKALHLGRVEAVELIKQNNCK